MDCGTPPGGPVEVGESVEETEATEVVRRGGRDAIAVVGGRSGVSGGEEAWGDRDLGGAAANPSLGGRGVRSGVWTKGRREGAKQVLMFFLFVFLLECVLRPSFFDKI